MKTLYISDLDGTLLQPDITLSANTIGVLNELHHQGAYFSVATARSIASVRTILKDVILSVPVILMNGVCIYDLNKNEYVKIETFSRESIQALMALIKEYHLKGFAYVIKDGVMNTYYEDLNTQFMFDFYQERVDLYQKRFDQIESFSHLADQPLIYFTLMDTKERLEPFYDIIKIIPDLNCVLYKDNYTPNMWFLELYSKKASKYHGVQYLRSHYGFDTVVCFGDNRNDLPLFEASDIKIAVDNSVNELKEKADIVIGRNTEEGVATWLRENAIASGS